MGLFDWFGSPNVEKLKAAKNTEKLLEAVGHQNEAIALQAIEALGEIGVQDEAHSLGVFANDTRNFDSVRAMVKEVLVQHIDRLKANKDVEKLLQSVTLNQITSARAAVAALAEVGTSEVAPKLVALLDDSRLLIGVDTTIAEVLGEIGDACTADALLSLLQEKRQKVAADEESRKERLPSLSRSLDPSMEKLRVSLQATQAKLDATLEAALQERRRMCSVLVESLRKIVQRHPEVNLDPALIGEAATVGPEGDEDAPDETYPIAHPAKDYSDTPEPAAEDTQANADVRQPVVELLNHSTRLAQVGKLVEASEDLLRAWELACELDCTSMFHVEAIEDLVRRNCCAYVDGLIDEEQESVAIRLLEWQTGVYPDAFFAHCSLGRLAFRQGDYTAAIGHYQTSLEFGWDSPYVEPGGLAQSTLALTGAHYQMGDQQEALACVEDALERYDWPPQLEDRLHQVAKKVRDGTAVFVGRTEDIQKAGVPWEDLLDQANRLDDEGNFNHAVSLYKKLVELVPDEARVYFNYGVACVGQDDPELDERAIDLYEKALELDPSHAGAHANLGTMYFGKGTSEKAAVHLQQAVEGGVDEPSIFYYLAICHMRMERFSDALSCLEAALAKNPDPGLESQIRESIQVTEEYAVSKAAARNSHAQDLGSPGGIVIEKDDDHIAGGIVVEKESAERQDGGASKSTLDRFQSLLVKAGASTGDKPLQLVTADTIRDLGRQLAEAMGKTFIRTMFTVKEGDRTEVTFECDDGSYTGIASSNTVEIYQDDKLVQTIERT